MVTVLLMVMEVINTNTRNGIMEVVARQQSCFFLLQILIEGDDARNLGELVSQVSLVLVFSDIS